ncbi:MAG: FecR family protein [Flavobacteriaceae bacterium]|nr:FecR family protein [Flavobacteriaceae bacterium]
MNREELIIKWLDKSLNSQELEQFKALEDFDELVKLDKSINYFKAPEYDTSEGLETILSSVSETKKPNQNWTTPLTRIAAIFILGFSIFYYTSTLDTTIDTLASEKSIIELPDGSSTNINALTTLSYNKKNWKSTRDVNLNGEAFFKVKKGSTFNVITENGTVTVLGTQFNVKHRENFFEVICYEGSVSVTNNIKNTVLKPGDSYLILDGKYIAKEKETLKNPNWINNKSYFKSIPFKYVINEFERQYNVKIDTQNTNLSKLYSGSFTHSDINLALKSITLPFNLNYSITENTIYIASE